MFSKSECLKTLFIDANRLDETVTTSQMLKVKVHIRFVNV